MFMRRKKFNYNFYVTVSAPTFEEVGKPTKKQNTSFNAWGKRKRGLKNYEDHDNNFSAEKVGFFFSIFACGALGKFMHF